jgi:hypothetical protein
MSCNDFLQPKIWCLYLPCRVLLIGWLYKNKNFVFFKIFA